MGAAFYRELFWQSLQADSIDYNAAKFRQNIAQDILNPIIFSLLVNDLFIRAQFFKYDERRYQKDRGVAFEEQLNINTTGFLDKPLISYRLPEVQAKIPMMILSPTIANDGRKLYISPQSVSYMNIGQNLLGDNYKVTGVDFMRFFWEQDAANLRFLSALRMSASFPYITPNVVLPSSPPLQIMDAGISDNFGISDAVRFMYTFKEWLEQNTSGVILVSIRDTRKNNPVEAKARQSIIQKFSSPISSVYNNLSNLQDINNDTNLAYAQEWFGAPIDLINIEYNTYINLPDPENVTEQQQLENKEIERASLSWHLTTREKHNILQNIFRPSNQMAIDQLRKIIISSEE